VTAPAGREDEFQVGVAIVVPEPWMQELRAARARFGDPRALMVTPHVTLVPPMIVGRAQIDAVKDHLTAACAQVEPFTLHLRGTGTFRPISPVVFVNIAQGIAGCEQLENRMVAGPLACPLAFPYHPHVTVAHEIAEPDLDRAFRELAGFEAQFEVTSAHLFFQGDDRVWRPQCQFELGAGGRAGL
jgi:2'-5' RNA ligase